MGYTESSNQISVVYPREKPREYTGLNERPTTPDSLKQHVGPMPNKFSFPPIFPLAYKKLMELQVEMMGMHITAAQAAEIINYFPDEGYCRVICFQSLFNCIVDVDNILMIYDQYLVETDRVEVRMCIMVFYLMLCWWFNL